MQQIKAIRTFFTAMLALAFAISACRTLAPGSTETTAAIKTAKPAASQLPPAKAVTAPAAIQTAQAGAAGLDGAWKGLSSSKAEVEFHVEQGQVTYFYLNYHPDNSACPPSSEISQRVAAPVVDNRFSVEWSDGANKHYRFTGQFFSASSASGFADLTELSDSPCKLNTQMDWLALSQAAIAAGTPVVAPPPLPIAP
jgi:hypothetical protein